MKPYFYLYFVVLVLFLVLPMVTLGQYAGALDPTFNYGVSQFNSLGFNQYQGGVISASKLQPDGKIIIVGNFYNYANKGINYVARLNVDGTVDTSFDIGRGPMWSNVPNSSIGISSVAIQSDGKILVGGHFRGFNNRAYSGLVRLHTNGSLDTTFNIGSGFNANRYAHYIRAIAIQNDGKIIVGGNFNKYNGVNCNNLLRLNQNGTADASFVSGTGFNEVVSAIALTNDSKIIVGGFFSTYNGAQGKSVVRLFSNGAIDNTFRQTQDLQYGIVKCLALLPNGKILVGGSFTNNSTTPTLKHLICLNETGALDSLFPRHFITRGDGLGECSVNDIAIQPDGKIVFVGSFSNIYISAYNGLARLNANGNIDGFINNQRGFRGNEYTSANTILLKPNGKFFIGGNFSSFNGYPCQSIVQIDSNAIVDSSFNSLKYLGPKGQINKIGLLNDGKIVVGGSFTQINNGGNPKNLSRLYSNGALDSTFQIGTGTNGPVSEVVVQPDSKILVAGGFTSFNGTVIKQMVRLNSTGRIDSSFSIGYGTSADSGEITINKILLQPDGKIFVGGSFNLFNGVLKNGLVRLNSDGSIDNSFNTGTGLGSSNDFITDFCLLDSGKVVIVGSFSNFNGTQRQNIARLNSDGSIDTTFNIGNAISNDIGPTMIKSVFLDVNQKIIIAGGFRLYNGRNCSPIIRFNINGTLDSTYAQTLIPVYNSGGLILKAKQAGSDGKIYLNMYSTSWDGYTFTEYYNIFRLDTNGAIENNFRTPVNKFYDVEIQPDNKILYAGSYTFTQQNLLTPIIRVLSEDCPEPAILTVSGSTTLCEGETGILTSSAATGNIWSTGDTTRSIRVLAGTYAIVSQIVNGCTTATTNFETIGYIDINYAPEIPFIDYANRDSLIASTDSCSYQWTYNGVVQPFTTRKIPVQGFGEYTVRAISNLGCRSRNSQVFSILSARRLKQLVKLDLYPNPTLGKVNISTSSDADNITVFNSVGKLVYKIKAEENMELDLSQFSKGVYLVQVQSAKGVTTERLVVR